MKQLVADHLWRMAKDPRTCHGVECSTDEDENENTDENGYRTIPARMARHCYGVYDTDEGLLVVSLLFLVGRAAVYIVRGLARQARWEGKIVTFSCEELMGGSSAGKDGYGCRRGTTDGCNYGSLR